MSEPSDSEPQPVLDSSELYRLADAHWLTEESEEAVALYRASLESHWHSITELRVAQCLFTLGRFEEIHLVEVTGRNEGWKRLEALLALTSQDAEALRSLVDWTDSPKLKRRIGLAISVLTGEAELTQIIKSDRETVQRMVGWARNRDVAAMLGA